MIKYSNRLLIIIFILVVALSNNLFANDYQVPSTAQNLLSDKPVYPVTKFIIMSDTHYYNKSLGISGKAFQKYLDNDRKLLVESDEILSTAINELNSIEADFVIIPGDLTKDGERINHFEFAKKIKLLKDAGKKVFVVPGNHDVANGNSLRFEGDLTEAVPSVSGEQFPDIYSDFGYSASIERDPGSLSYLVEPVPGLWLLALDSCRWKENKPDKHPITGGAFSKETLSWIESMLIRSKTQKKAVIAFMHHGIIEHYPSNEKFYGAYLVDNRDYVAKMMAEFGVSLVFTGHFHAQDIVKKEFGDRRNVIFDIETGSLVTAPCPYRIVSITKEQKAIIQSRFISSIPSHPNEFAEYSDKYVFEGTLKLADKALAKYRVSENDRVYINPQISKAYATHLKGDEVKPGQVLDTSNIGIWAKLIVYMQENLIYGWYTDLPPGDNQLTIDLTNGTY